MMMMMKSCAKQFRALQVITIPLTRASMDTRGNNGNCDVTIASGWPCVDDVTMIGHQLLILK